MSPAEQRAQLWTIIATILVSTSFPIGAAITHGLDSVVLTLLRFVLAAIMFAPVVIWKFGLPMPTIKDLGRYSVLSALMVGYFWAMFEALRYTSPLNTATIFTLTPAIGAAVAAVVLRERLKNRSFIALALGLVGAVWVIYRGNLDSFLALSFNKGDAIFFAGTVCIGVYGPLIKFFHRGEPMARMSFWVMATGSVWLLLIALPRFDGVVWSDVPVNVYWGIAYLALFTTLITFFIFQWSATVIGPTKVLSYTYVQPALVLVIGLMLGDNPPPVMTYPGIIIVFSAMVVLQLAAPKPTKA